MEFNQRLGDLRQDKDLSQVKLGEILNIQQAAISKYELGTLMVVSKRIKKLRKDNGKTQTEIANFLGTSQSYYAQYENNKRDLPLRHFAKLCVYYNVTADYILGLSTTPNMSRFDKQIEEDNQ